MAYLFISLETINSAETELAIIVCSRLRQFLLLERVVSFIVENINTYIVMIVFDHQSGYRGSKHIAVHSEHKGTMY